MTAHRGLCRHTTHLLLPQTLLRTTCAVRIANSCRDGFHREQLLKGFPPGWVTPNPSGDLALLPNTMVPMGSMWFKARGAQLQHVLSLHRREDINTHTSKPTKQMMKVTVKWLFLHPYFPIENDADQKQKPIPKAALPALQLKSL